MSKANPNPDSPYHKLTPEQKARRRTYNRRWYKDNPEKMRHWNSTASHKESKKRTNLKNKEKIRAYNKEYRTKDPEKTKQRDAANYARNAEKHKRLATEWAKNNPVKVKARNSLARATRINATPQWADRMAIEKIYEYAHKNGLHVDHIVPLRNKKVCGLHVPWNLAPIDRTANNKKYNKFLEHVSIAPTYANGLLKRGIGWMRDQV